jgi:predicted ATP-grasp superfamily ATP-dependent carboligase
MQKHLVPAVVIGGELNGLSVCRSLAAGGIPTYVLDTKRRNPAMWSRYATPVKTEILRGSQLILALQHLQKRLGERPVLIITDEMALLTISEHRESLLDLYRFRLPPHNTVLMLHDKAEFHKFAMANNLPIPNGAIVSQLDDLLHLDNLRFPIVIKPADKRYYHLIGVPRLVIAHDLETAQRVCTDLLRKVGQIIVQERIDGPDSNIYFGLFYRQGNSTVLFTGQKLASMPPGTGSTALCVAVPPGEIRDRLDFLTHDFLASVDYIGFGGIEYKWDAMRDRYAIIEPTVGRTDWQEEIASLCGVNIPLLGYYYECDEPLTYDLSPVYDVIWQGSYVERMKLGRQHLPRYRLFDGFWRRDDPMPAIVHYPFEFFWSIPAIMLGLLQRSLTKRLKRVN